MRMTKQEATAIFGEHYADLARALELTRAAISQWPEQLTELQADRVLGAAIRLARPIPARFLNQCPPPRPPPRCRSCGQLLPKPKPKQQQNANSLQAPQRESIESVIAYHAAAALARASE